MKYSIITDTSFSLSSEDIEKYDVSVLNLRTFINDKELGKDISNEEFFRLLKDDENADVKTSAPSPAEIEDFIKSAKEKSENVIYLTISGKFSSTYQTAKVIANNYEGVEIFDTKNVFAANKILFDYLVKNLDTDLTVEEIISNLEKLRDNTYTYFIVKSLSYLQKNGRIGKAGAVIGELMSIKPILFIDDEGSVSSFAKARSNKKAVDKIIDMINNCESKNIYASQINSSDDIEYFVSKVENVSKDQVIPAVIAVHAGPDTFAVSFSDNSKIDFEV